MVEAAKYVGADEETAQAQMKDVLDFEIKLAELTVKKEDRRNKTALNNKIKLNDVSGLYDIDWVNIINDMHDNPTNENQVNIKINKDNNLFFIMKYLKSLFLHSLTLGWLVESYRN